MERYYHITRRNMKKLIVLVFALLTISWAQAPKITPPTCSLQSDYSCADITKSLVDLGAAPFNPAMPANTVVKLTVLSKAKVVRITDDAFGKVFPGCRPWAAATPSGGSYDIITNTLGTMMGVSCNGSFKVLGFNPATLQLTNLQQVLSSPSTVNSCEGDQAWSRVKSNVLYCRQAYNQIVPPMTVIRKLLSLIGLSAKANGSTIYAITFPFTSSNACGTGIGTCPDPTVKPTWSVVYDLVNCPQGSKLGKVTSGSIFGLGRNDEFMTMNLSSGQQNSARYEFAYFPKTKTCETVDTQGDGTTAQVYLESGQHAAINALTGKPLKAVWSIHSSNTSNMWTLIGIANCIGVDCGKGDAPAMWQNGSPSILMLNLTPSAGGHGTLTKSTYVNGNNPTFSKRLLTDPMHPSLLATFTYSPMCCQDEHIVGDINSDTNAVIGTSAGPWSGKQPGPYQNIVFGLSMTTPGKVFRFGPTFTSAKPEAGFRGQYGIGGVNQPRTVFCFSSDMNGQLGTYNTGTKVNNITDVFCIGLVGQ